MTDFNRVFYCIDMKSFFASVECAERGLDPLTTNLIVADPSVNEGAICLAISPHLKKLGIKNRCRVYDIPKEIGYIKAKPRMKKYIEYAAEIYSIYLKYIDKKDIHVYSIDECFIDATDYLKLYKLTAKEFVLKLINEIRGKLLIPASAGIGTNLFLAKVALDITAKHSADHIGFLTEEDFKKTLWNHRPISDFWQISRGLQNRLKKFGIYDMEGIAKADESVLYKEFGINAELLIDHAWGRENCLISDIKNYKSKDKSISNSQILPENYTFDEAQIIVNEMLQTGCYRLFKENLVTELIHLYVCYSDDEDGKDVDKGCVRLPIATNLYTVILGYVEKLFKKITDKKKLIRKIGFEFSCLSKDEFERYDFFTDLVKVDKEKKVVSKVIFLQEKFGKNAILKGIDLSKKATQMDRNGKIGGHNGG